MSEWNYDTTGIEIGQSIWAHVETETREGLTKLKKIHEEIYTDIYGLGIRVEKNKIRAWKPLPDETQKRHECED